MNQYGILMCRDLLNGFCTINQSLGWAQFSLAQFSIIRVQLSLQLDSTILKFYNAIYPFAFDVDNLLVKFCHLTHKFNEQIISTKVKGRKMWNGFWIKGDGKANKNRNRKRKMERKRMPFISIEGNILELYNVKIFKWFSMQFYKSTSLHSISFCLASCIIGCMKFHRVYRKITYFSLSYHVIWMICLVVECIQ